MVTCGYTLVNQKIKLAALTASFAPTVIVIVVQGKSLFFVKNLQTIKGKLIWYVNRDELVKV